MNSIWCGNDATRWGKAECDYLSIEDGLTPYIETKVLFRWAASVNPARWADCFILDPEAIALKDFCSRHHKIYLLMVMPVSFLKRCINLLSDKEHILRRSGKLIV